MIVDGVEMKEDKSLLQNTVDSLNKYSDVELFYDEIDQCNYYGKLQRDNQPRPVRLQLKDRRRKKDLLRRKGQFRTSPIFIKEHLTTKNNTLFYHA